MTVNKRNDQIMTTLFEGASNALLTGKETGSKMLSVNEITLDAGAKSEYYEITNVEESLFVTEGQITFRLGDNIFTALEVPEFSYPCPWDLLAKIQSPL